MPTATPTPIPANVVAGLEKLSTIGANLRTVKAAAREIIPVLAQAMFLTPEQRVETSSGRVYRLSGPSAVAPPYIHVGENADSHLLPNHGHDQDWAHLVIDLPEITAKLLEDPNVRAASDPRLEKLAHVLDD